MSPSRGGLPGVARLLRARSSAVIARQRHHQLVRFSPAKHPCFSSSSCSAAQQLTAAQDQSAVARSIGSQPGQSSSSPSLAPRGPQDFFTSSRVSEARDGSLFEAENDDYDSHVRRAQQIDSAAAKGALPASILGELLSNQQDGIKDATAVLLDMLTLDTEIDSQAHFARAAVECVRRGNLRGGFAWLEVVPPLVVGAEGADVPRPARDVSDTDHNAGTTLALVQIPSILISSGTSPNVVSRAIVTLASLRALEAGEAGFGAVADGFTWLLRNAHSVEDTKDLKWSWGLWQSIVTSAANARLVPLVSKNNKQSAELTINNMLPRSADLAGQLDRLFNRAIRTLVRGQKYEEAAFWVAKSSWFQVGADDFHSLERRARKLRRSSWRFLVEEVFRQGSPASAAATQQVNALLRTLYGRIDGPRQSRFNNQLTRSMITIANDAKKGRVSAKRGQSHIQARSGEASVKDFDNQSVLSTSPILMTDVSASPSHDKLARPSSNGLTGVPTRGSVEVVQMAYHQRAGALVKTLEIYCLTFEDRYIGELMQCCLEELEIHKIKEASGQKLSKVWPNSHAFTIALRSLVLLCDGNVGKLDKLYSTWLGIVKQNIQTGPTGVSSTARNLSSSSSPQLTSSVFEEDGAEYLVQPFEPKLDYRSPLSHGPNVHHFNIFLRALPRACAAAGFGRAHSPEESGSILLLRGTSPLDAASRVMDDLEELGATPTIATWSLLLEALALSSGNPEARPLRGDESSSEPFSRHDDAMETMWRLAAALGMNEDARESAQRGLDERSIVHVAKEVSGLKRPPSRPGMSGDDLSGLFSAMATMSAAAGSGRTSSASSKEPEASAGQVQGADRPSLPPSPPSGGLLARATPLTYAILIRALLGVHRIRGGPLVAEASKVAQWLDADDEVLRVLASDPGRYRQAVQAARDQLAAAQAELADTSATAQV